MWISLRISWIANTQRITPKPALMYPLEIFTMLLAPIVAPTTTAIAQPTIRGMSNPPLVRCPKTPNRDEKITMKLTTPAEFLVGYRHRKIRNGTIRSPAADTKQAGHDPDKKTEDNDEGIHSFGKCYRAGPLGP